MSSPGAAIALNTDTTSAARGTARNTHALDDHLHDLLLSVVFPALEGQGATR